jgi:hypothetical protein
VVGWVRGWMGGKAGRKEGKVRRGTQVDGFG